MQLKRKFDTGEFAILAEMEPPKGVDVSMMLANAAKVKGKVDAVVVSEMNNAVMRMSALGAAVLLQHKGLETVMQVCCRDRNRLALQADLLAAAASAIPNILVVSGENISFGDHHDAKAVDDMDGLQLLQAIQKLQQGRDMAGIDLDGAPSFVVGSSVKPASSQVELDIEKASLVAEIQAGVQFFITPPVFDLAAIEDFKTRLGPNGPKIIPTVLLLKSVGMARYIDRNLGHVNIPEALIARLQQASDKVRECIRITAETIVELRAAGFSGVHIATLGWENRLTDILDRI